jgi:hypothetical protein
MFIDNPGLSVLAIDPGGTTGIAIWDAWTQKLYVDQVDAGRGRKARERVYPGVIESFERKKGQKAFGKTNEMEVLSFVEAGVVTVLCDLVLAMGPLSVVICEDFVLRKDLPVRSGGREGLSPVRIGARLDERLRFLGLLNGDAWRRWSVFQSTGMDLRGVRVATGKVSGAALTFEARLRLAEKWDGGLSGDSVVWAGGGAKLIWRMPGARLWLAGGESAVVEWLKGRGMWMPGAPHGMDALMHLVAFGRKMGVEYHSKPERLWEGRR